MEFVTSLEGLAVKFEEAKQQQKISDDAFRQSLAGWTLSPNVIGEVPSDPFSAEYKAFQLEFYRSLTSRQYETSNEEVVFDLEHERRYPYPYGTRSADTVGTHLMGYGWLIKKMDLPVPSRILEIGAGYGSLTIHLARMGYEVTCLDINAPLLEFIEERTADAPIPVKTICGDMATVEIDGTYDAVIFNASFHHTAEHRAVIERFDKIVVPGGIIAFTAEPVVPDDSPYVPYPWGIRLSGISVWSICQFGWLELGFQESYFVDLLTKAGWGLVRSNLGISGHTDVWIASRGTLTQQAVSSGSAAGYMVDAETELNRLRLLVEGYENGRVIRLINWVKRFLPL